MDVKVATNIMRAEAGTWDAQSDQMGTARGKVDAMELGMIEAGVFMPLVHSYNELVQTLRSRCDEGSHAMTEVGKTLRNVADTYDNTDEASARKIAHIQ
jgi:uncharacterized protein YukE